MKELRDSVFRMVMRIPKGRVTTYAEVARCCWSHPRAIGRVLHSNTRPRAVPCYRVVRSDGSLGGYNRGMRMKKRMLASDGIAVRSGRVDIKKYFYGFRRASVRIAPAPRTAGP